MEMNLLDDVHFMLPQESDQQRKENELTELEQSSFVDFLKDADDDSVVELSEDEEKKLISFLFHKSWCFGKFFRAGLKSTFHKLEDTRGTSSSYSRNHFPGFIIHDEYIK